MADATVRTEAQIAEDAVNAVVAQTRLSDISPISALRVILEQGFAPEVAQLYDAAIQVEENSHPHSATGDALDRRMADYGITRRGAVKARGMARFSRVAEEDDGDWTLTCTIPEGYQVKALDLDGNEVAFVTLAELVIDAATEHGEVAVEAVAAGIAGNIGSGTLTVLGPFIDQLGAVTNDAPFVSGAARERDEDLQMRFSAWLDARPRTTPSAPGYGAETYEDGDGHRPIHSASVSEYLSGGGAVGQACDVYVWGTDGRAPGADVIAAVQQRIDGYTDGTGLHIDGWRPGGCKVVVKRAIARPVDVHIRLELSASGSDRTRRGLSLAIEQHLAALRVGRPLRKKRIFDLICDFGFAIENAHIERPEDDVVPSKAEKITAGTIFVEVV